MTLNGGLTRALQVVMTTLAGAAFIALLVMQHDVTSIAENQSLAITRVLTYIDHLDDRSQTRHDNLLQICLTMEERMCDRLCKEQRPGN